MWVPFRSQGKLVKGSEDWIMKLLCLSYNHVLSKTLVGYPMLVG